MKCRIVLAFLLSTIFSFAQLNGDWKGIMVRDGQSGEASTILYVSFEKDGSFIAKTREEYINKSGFAVKKCKGTVKGNHAEISQFVVQKKKDITGVKWCNLILDLNYIDSTGYLQGTFRSVECRGYSGKVTLTKAISAINTEESKPELQAWVTVFMKDLKAGLKSVELRDFERKNFKFEPIYFDYDKFEIKSEYNSFLQQLIRVVNGHTDLRIKVIGHTDADGSDEYNIDLSEKRAAAIIAYFVSKGIAADRIEIEFKGEKEPIGDNTTPEGKQLNRRVDFFFI